ncbi:glycosyltransferase family 61 protein [Pseudochryseolinea flava]|uniref:Glycosyltransferase 61 catalytic domain-containing protein n=1 Tax=Pseudochryseolinea flava TaxID=2059302 RepID=A0A364Y6P8_9BACT|nr:glycosyltransferase family 61 protein [Pseudochryseolinea flava]RAW02647.1 hypothetical protein DQQ10_00625 [Pseudochryseolinea flava]
MKTIVAHNVFLTRSGIAMKAFRLIDESIHRYPGKRRHFWKYTLFQFFFRKKLKLKGKYFVIHNHWCPGYYHWITEALPRLLSVHTMLEDRILVLPISFQEKLGASLAPLYQGEIFWIPESKNLLVDDLLIPENPFSGRYEPSLMKALRELYMGYLNLQLVPSKRIYISRKKAARRRVENEVAVEHMLHQYGFEIVCFEDRTFWEQVQLMCEAQLLISIHGAGLSNVLFLSENSHVIELQHHPAPGMQKDVLYQDLCEIMNVQYRAMFCDSSGNDNTLATGDIFVDIPELENLVIEKSKKINL